MKINRRRFIQSIAAAATTPALSNCAGAAPRATELRSDPDGIIDLPPDFRYTIVSRFGDRMDDGLRVPAAHDGMAAFAGGDGRVRLVCNHELTPTEVSSNTLSARFAKLPAEFKARLYDCGENVTPGLGGTTTTVFNPATGKTERQFLSLAGTELNCAGGPTPWGSWLSCEECFESPGRSGGAKNATYRSKPHGYVFEVPAAADSLTEAVPIKAMGRFEHEACAVDPATGNVYMTEDRFHSLFYRYVPKTPGKLLRGGRLQALVVRGIPTFSTNNWTGPAIRQGQPMAADWVDLKHADLEENELRLYGASLGAALFARGEGLTFAGDQLAFTCTIGGPARLGQVFTYTPTSESSGNLELIAESSPDSLLRNADNLTMAPWGDLIVCEDTNSHCGLVGIRPDGSQYALADNPYSSSELAGVCFSPDGETLFVNIQYPGMTVAITGPWQHFGSGYLISSLR